MMSSVLKKLIGSSGIRPGSYLGWSVRFAFGSRRQDLAFLATCRRRILAVTNDQPWQ